MTQKQKPKWNAGRIAGEICDGKWMGYEGLRHTLARALREAYKRGVYDGRGPIKIEQLQPRRIEIDDDDDETERGF